MTASSPHRKNHPVTSYNVLGLTLAMLKYKPWRFFQFEIILNVFCSFVGSFARSLARLFVRGGPRVVVSTAAFHAGVRVSVPGLGSLKETKIFLPHPRVKLSIVGSLCDREVACSASDRQGSNFESCVISFISLSSGFFSWPSLAYICTKRLPTNTESSQVSGKETLYFFET